MLKNLNLPKNLTCFLCCRAKVERKLATPRIQTSLRIQGWFSDVRWKNGTWDLNMFVEKGRMDWDAVIVAEAKRRKFLELYPQVSTNEEPVLFRTSIVPWWAWMTHSHLPEAELLNGRAAMVGFFTAYIVDALTGLDVVGQTGNFICKGALFLIIISVIVFRRKEDFKNVRKLADEATFYEKQWRKINLQRMTNRWSEHKTNEIIFISSIEDFKVSQGLRDLMETRSLLLTSERIVRCLALCFSVFPITVLFFSRCGIKTTYINYKSCDVRFY